MANILLIDDDETIRSFLLEKLRQRGDEAWCLERAEGGFDILDNGNIDLVLVDEDLKGGMHGTEFLKLIRKRGNDVAVILMTGFAPTPIKEKVEHLNAIVVSKPFGGLEQFWIELAPRLDQALKGEAEIRACLGRALDAAFKRRKKGVAPYLQELLDGVLLHWSLTLAGGNPKDAEGILGVRLKDLMKKKEEATPEARRQQFVMKALILIHNHPEWTVDDYANDLGCTRNALYKNPIINEALKRRKGSSGL
jgi:CheY-like chemotaxis protein